MPYEVRFRSLFLRNLRTSIASENALGTFFALGGEHEGGFGLSCISLPDQGKVFAAICFSMAGDICVSNGEHAGPHGKRLTLEATMGVGDWTPFSYVGEGS